MSVVTLACVIVAAFLGGLTYEGTGRAGGSGTLAFALGLLVAFLVYALLPEAL